MIRRTLQIAALFVFTAVLSSAAVGQEINQDVFNHPPEAFSNHVADVPPDILKVATVPPQPVAGKSFRVEAVVRVDDEMSVFKVVSAKLIYTTDDATFKALPMKKVAAKKDLWSAEIPAQLSGSRVRFYISGEDEVGNSVFEIPVQSPPDPKKLWAAVSDVSDKFLPGSLDILSVSYGTDGATLWFCENFARQYLTTAFYGVSFTGIGIVANDARAVRYRSTTDDNVPFIAYIPFLNKRGIYTLGSILNGQSQDSSVKVSHSGNHVCGTAPISDLTPTPQRGLKMFAATAAYNTGKDEYNLYDATPYVILYFKGHEALIK